MSNSFLMFYRCLFGSEVDVCGCCKGKKKITHLVELRQRRPLLESGYTRALVVWAVCADCAGSAVAKPEEEQALIRKIQDWLDEAPECMVASAKTENGGGNV